MSICNPKQLKLCGKLECKICNDRSFATSINAHMWSDKNKLKSYEIRKGSEKKYIFYCNSCNHEYLNKVCQMNKSNCIFCTNQRLCDDPNCNSCEKKSFKNNKYAIYWSDKNLPKSPRDVFKSSSHGYYFNCPDCKHVFYMKIELIAKNIWCYYCANRRLCDDSNCVTCENKSFQHNKYAIYWSDKNVLTSRQVFRSTASKYFFDCPTCKHEILLSLNSISSDDVWCIYCANKKLCDNSNCIICKEKSFQHSKYAIYWSDKNLPLTPRQISIYSNKYIYLYCSICNHEIFIAPHALRESKGFCNYCSHDKLCSNITCLFCNNMSFNSSDKAKYWSNKNKLLPREVFKSSSSKYYFNCSDCKNELFISLNGISSKNSWCKYCIRKTEKLLFKWLKEKFKNYTITTEQTFDYSINSKTNRNYRYDFYIKELNLVIELDGEQHISKQIKNWTSPKDQLIIDTIKANNLINNNISIIRILQEDVYHNKNNWDLKLESLIKSYDNPSYILIKNNFKYMMHMIAFSNNNISYITNTDEYYYLEKV